MGSIIEAPERGRLLLPDRGVCYSDAEPSCRFMMGDTAKVLAAPDSKWPGTQTGRRSATPEDYCLILRAKAPCPIWLRRSVVVTTPDTRFSITCPIAG